MRYIQLVEHGAGGMGFGSAREVLRQQRLRFPGEGESQVTQPNEHGIYYVIIGNARQGSAFVDFLNQRSMRYKVSATLPADITIRPVQPLTGHSVPIVTISDPRGLLPKLFQRLS